MNNLPLWWTDIVRSRMEALESYARILDKLEAVLDSQVRATGDSKKQRRLAESWAALLKVEKNVSDRLSSVLRLSESRYLDVRQSGFEVPAYDAQQLTLAADNACRARALNKRISHSMQRLNSELSQRNPRRPSFRKLRDSRPSQIDLHA